MEIKNKYFWGLVTSKNFQSKKKISSLAAIILLAAFLSGCSEYSVEKPETDNTKVDVIVSILPQKAFVKAVGGDLVSVKELIPPGGSPHTYEPKPGDLISVERSDIYFRIGHIQFERSHIDKFAGLNPDMKIIDTSADVELRYFGGQEGHTNEDWEHKDNLDVHGSLSEECREHEGTWIEEQGECEGISMEICQDMGGEFDECASACRNEPDAGICTMQCVLVCSFDANQDEGYEEHYKEEHNHEGVDPHIWLSPMQVKKQIDIIAKTLSEEDPANADTYHYNAEMYKEQLDALHSEIGSVLAELKTDKLMVFHPAWGYFTDEFGLEQIAIEQSGKEPTAQELKLIIEEAKEEEIRVIFLQSQFSKTMAESVAKEVGAIVVNIDPLSEDYIRNLRNVAATIAEGLN